MSPVVKKKRKKITITSQQLLLVLTAVCAFLLIFTFNTNVFEGVLKQAAGYVVVPFQNGIAAIGGYLSDRSDELAQFLAANGLQIAGFSREITLIDNCISDDPAQYVTEIRIPVARG